MKRLLILLCGALASLPAAAQDIILLRDASEITARVEAIDEQSIAYRNFDNPTGPLRRIARERVVSITYANGEKEVYADERAQSASAPGDDYPWPTVSRSYRVGEFFSEGGVVGIVIHVSDDGRHGLLVSLDMDQSAFAGSGLETVQIGMSDRLDGWRNMQVLERFVQANGLTWGCFPAFAWCRGQGPGWYIPAVDELKHLSCFDREGRYPRNELDIYRVCRALGRACEEYGGVGFGPFSAYPISSTEASGSQVWHMLPDREKGARPRDHVEKNFPLSVKAFHRF